MSDLVKFNPDDLKSLSTEKLNTLLQEQIKIAKSKKTLQSAVKTILASLYGALGNNHFRLFNVEIARAVTSQVRFYLKLLSKRMNDFLNIYCETKDVDYTIGADTDSNYYELENVTKKLFTPTDTLTQKIDKLDEFIENNIQKVVDDVNLELADILNAKDASMIKAEREAISDVAIWVAKKRYVMRVYDMEGVRYAEDEPYFKKMGLEIVKSSTPEYSKIKLTQGMKLLFDKSNEDLRIWLKSVKDEFIHQDLDKIAKVSSVSNLNYSLDKVEYDDKGRKIAIPINSRAVLVSNRYILDNNLNFNLIQENDKVKLLYLVEPNPLNSNIFAFTDVKFANLFKKYIDYDTIWDKYFLQLLKIMTDPINYNIDTQSEILDEW